MNREQKLENLLKTILTELNQANSKEQLTGYFNQLAVDHNSDLEDLDLPQLEFVLED